MLTLIAVETVVEENFMTMNEASENGEQQDQGEKGNQTSKGAITFGDWIRRDTTKTPSSIPISGAVSNCISKVNR